MYVCVCVYVYVCVCRASDLSEGSTLLQAWRENLSISTPGASVGQSDLPNWTCSQKHTTVSSSIIMYIHVHVVRGIGRCFSKGVVGRERKIYGGEGGGNVPLDIHVLTFQEIHSEPFWTNFILSSFMHLNLSDQNNCELAKTK